MSDTQVIYSMMRVGRIHPPNKQVLRDISLSYYYGAKIGVLASLNRNDVKFLTATDVLGRLLSFVAGAGITRQGLVDGGRERHATSGRHRATTMTMPLLYQSTPGLYTRGVQRGCRAQRSAFVALASSR